MFQKAWTGWTEYITNIYIGCQIYNKLRVS